MAGVPLAVRIRRRVPLSSAVSNTQALTYLFCVCLFSISFLVFLNSSVSFVVTELLHISKGVGNIVGSLGFADELLALVACPLWGVISDRIGVRTVSVAGYGIVALSLVLFVQARNVYPQLLLARLFFSLGGAATSTMVTAVLAIMTIPLATDGSHREGDSSRLAGIVGMFTGAGALIALVVFLPLPTRYNHISEVTPELALKYSFYTVGLVALIVGVIAFFGLRNLPGEERKNLRNMFSRSTSARTVGMAEKLVPYWTLAWKAILAGFKDSRIGVGYVGGFVARASSVCITVFIPLFVNAYFIDQGLCKVTNDPSGLKKDCRQAYVLASMLTGISQLVALICAPLFGYFAAGSFAQRYQLPAIIPAIAGIFAYVGFANLKTPEYKGPNGSPTIFLLVSLIGISQIGAIVGSLGQLSRGVQAHESRKVHVSDSEDVHDPLLPEDDDTVGGDVESIRGSVAGIYSFAGGAGILLLTKLGGHLFDTLSRGAPFYMLAIFNGILLVVGLACAVVPAARVQI